MQTITKPSLSLRNNQNWLLSYTDLFLLVLAFFVLRFSILKYDIPTTLPVSDKVPASIPEHKKLFFKVTPLKLDESAISIQTAVKPEWFSSTGLSVGGEREVNNLGKKIEESKKTAVLRIPNNYKGLQTPESNKEILLLIKNLQALGLTSLKIEQSVQGNTLCEGSQNQDNIACLVLDF